MYTRDVAAILRHKLRECKNKADRAIIEVICFYLLRTIHFWLRVVVCQNKTNPEQTDLYNVWNDFIHREYFSIRVHKIFLFYLLLLKRIQRQSFSSWPKVP